tara:strand:+ start:30 stop:227 length:198 start_codon:yes stop_codon:yes gene_type:complete
MLDEVVNKPRRPNKSSQDEKAYDREACSYRGQCNGTNDRFLVYVSSSPSVFTDNNELDFTIGSFG